MTRATPAPTPLSLRKLLAAPLLALGAALALAAVPQVAQARTVGSGTVATEARSVGEFQAVAQQGSIDLTVRQGAAASVQVSADDNLLPLLETVVEEGRSGPTLVVRFKRGERITTRNPVRVEIVTPKLVALASAGSGDVIVEAFSTPSLRLAISGSSDAKLNGLTTDELAISISGSGDVAGSGQAGKLTVSIAGSGDVVYSGNATPETKVAGSGSVRKR